MKKLQRMASVFLLATSLCPSVFAEEVEVVERQLLIKDGHFLPDTIEVPVGKKIRLIIRNEGPGPEEFESTKLGIESVSNAGVTRKVIIHPLEAGEYDFFGEFHMETAKGKIVAR